MPVNSGHSQPDLIGTDPRAAARQRLMARRDFTSHVVAYVVVNAALVMIWALTSQGYFWPAWVIGAWGVGLLLHGWDFLIRRPLTEDDIDAELQHHQR